ncbi:hypothetical protein D9M71_456170 [compost metagenome]
MKPLAAPASANAAASAADKVSADDVSSTVGALIKQVGGVSQGSAAQLTSVEYLEQRLPRVPDVPSSAPVYDSLTAPVSHPRLYCLSTSDPRLVARRPKETVKNGQSCQCYTQQGTKFSTGFDFCLAVARDGYFDPSIPDRSAVEQRMAQAPLPQPNNGQSYVPETAHGATVTIVPDSEYPSRPWRSR